MAAYDELRNEPTIARWLKRINKRPKTEKAYLLGFQKYVDFTGLSPAELLAEAKTETRENVDLDERAIVNRRIDFREYLETKTTLAPNSVLSAMNAVKSFYSSAYLNPPKLLGSNVARVKEENVEHITKEDIYELLKNCDILEKAIVLVGISSGLSASDIMDLKIRIIKNGYDPETGITTLPLTRIKTGVKFVTFLTPEASQAVWDYLKFRNKETTPKQHVRSDDDYLFIIRKISPKYDKDDPSTEELRKFTENAYTRMFARLAEKCQKVNLKGFNTIRSHNLRKFFNTTLRNAGFDFQFVDYMMGHKPDNVDGAYLKVDTQELKRRYLSCVPHLTINKALAAVDSPEYKEMVGKYEAEKTAREAAQLERYEYMEQESQLEVQRQWIGEQQRQIDELKAKLAFNEVINTTTPEQMMKDHENAMKTDPEYRKKFNSW